MLVNHSPARHFPSKALKLMIVRDIEELLPKLNNEKMITYKQIAYKYKYSPSSVQIIYQNYRAQVSKESIKDPQSFISVSEKPLKIIAQSNVTQINKVEDQMPQFDKQLKAIYQQNTLILSDLQELKAFNKQIQQYIMKSTTVGNQMQTRQKKEKRRDDNHKNPQKVLERMLAQKLEAIDNQFLNEDQKKLKHIIKKQEIVQKQLQNFIDNQDYQSEVNILKE